MPRLVGPVAAALLVAGGAPAVSPDPVLERLKADLFYLAGPACDGRGTGTPGIDTAAEYVAGQFRAAGVAPAGKGGSYFQPFTVEGQPTLGTPNTLTLAGPKPLPTEYGKQFRPTALTATGKFAGGLAFVGYGITAEKKGFDEYAGLDVAGKFVLVIRKAPRADRDKPFDADNQFSSLAYKIENAVAHKAAGVLFVNHASDKGDDLMPFDYARGQGTPTLPALHVTRAVAEELLKSANVSLADAEKGIDKDLKPRSAAVGGWTVSAEITVERKGIPAKNVVAVSEGSGPLADETVVIGAHYDHLGRNDRGFGGSLGGPAGRGAVHFGADDNASGTTALIEVARRFAAVKNRVGRRVLFIAFSGEEIALLGSRHYCKEPLYPLDKTAFMVNLDMVGRVTPVADDTASKQAGAAAGGAAAEATPVPMKDRLLVYGVGTSPGLSELVDGLNKPYDFKFLKLGAGTGPSDHDSFYRKNVPVLFFFTGTHRDYHRPSDTPDKVNLPGVAKVTGLTFDVAQHFATVTEKPKYLVTKDRFSDPTETSPRASRPSMPKLGVMPGNYEAADGGVLVDDVSPGGAAQKAGLKAGDVIVEIGGKPVKNIEGYMTAMAAQKAGVAVDVVILRKDQKLTLKATPTP